MYQSADEKNDNYYAGTYTFYVEQEALDYITKDRSEYGITKVEMLTIFAGNDDFELDNFVALTLNNESFVMDGEELASEAGVTYYYGFLLENESILDIASMDSRIYAWFVKE